MSYVRRPLRVSKEYTLDSSVKVTRWTEFHHFLAECKNIRPFKDPNMTQHKNAAI